MKSARTTVQVRIEVEQEKKLQELSDILPGRPSVTDLAREAIEKYLEIEYPVWMADAKKTRLKLVSCREKSASCLERQPVITDVAL